MKAPEEMTNEEIRVELSEIAIALADDPQSDLCGERIERRQALRHEVRGRAASPSDVDALRRELVGLQKRIGVIDHDRINPAAVNDGGDGGDGPLDAQKIAWTYDEAAGTQAIADRIAHIKFRLAQAEGTE